jgi:hypothetical protein
MFSLKLFERSDDDIKFWTGFFSYNSLIYFYNGFILPNEANMKYWGTKNTNVDRQFKTGMAHQLSPIDEMFLAATFRKTNIWLSKKKVRKLMPNSFKPIYSDVRVIIDCTELEIERPSDFEIQSAIRIQPIKAEILSKVSLGCLQQE